MASNSDDRAGCATTAGAAWPRMPRMVSTSTGSASNRMRTSPPPLGLTVPTGRSTRALSAGTAGSNTGRPSLVGIMAFRLSARGCHSSCVRSRSSTQYTCSPLPDATIMGLGNLLTATNSPTARSPSFQVENGLPGPQSTSRYSALMRCTLSCLRPAFLSTKDATA